MIVLAVDPGAHCGLAVRLSDGSIQHDMIERSWTEVWKFIHSLQPTVIVVERFATGGMMSRDGLDTVELQGSIFGLSWVMGSQLYVQSPAERMPFIEEARKLIGANKSKIQSHGVDAVAHLLRWQFMFERGRLGKPFLNAVK